MSSVFVQRIPAASRVYGGCAVLMFKQPLISHVTACQAVRTYLPKPLEAFSALILYLELK